MSTHICGLEGVAGASVSAGGNKTRADARNAVTKMGISANCLIGGARATATVRKGIDTIDSSH